MVKKSIKETAGSIRNHRPIAVLRNPHLWYVAVITMACSIFYYLSTIIDFMGWPNPRWNIFYTVHDLHRLLFVIPVLYATYIFRVKGVIVIASISILLFLIKNTLEMGRYQVTTTLSSLEALEIIKQKHFDLIFLDLLMPDLDGSELFKHIREINKDVPVIIVTGYPNSEVMARAMAYGPFLVLKKPFIINDILTAVHR